jgi:hypothetical protein
MAYLPRNRVAESTTSTGTGTIALAGALTGFRTFASILTIGDVVPYEIWGVDANGNATGEYEDGIATYSAANTLTRTTVETSSNANALVTFSAGTKWVTIGALQPHLANIDNTFALVMPDQSGTMLTPSVGGLLHIRNRAGRRLLGLLDPDGSGYSIQPALFSGGLPILWLPGTGTTLSANFSASWTARTVGTGAAQAHPTPATTNFLTQQRRATFGTGTTATGSNGIQNALASTYRGAAANRGGFFFSARVAVETLAADQRVIVGLSANNATLAADPSTLANTIALVKDTADANWFIASRDATTLTKTATGQAVTAGQVLDLYMYCKPNDTKVTVRLVDADTGTVIMNNVQITANLPVNTTLLFMQAHTLSVTGTTAKLLALMGMYCENTYP